MKIYSLDNSKLKQSIYQDGLYNLFEKTISYDQKVILKRFIVPREFEMRMDKISKYLYGVPTYVDELMTLNDIINPLSIKEGQEILFCDISMLTYLYKKDQIKDDFDERRNQLIKSSQQSNKQENDYDTLLPPTIKPRHLKKIVVDTKSRKIKIMRSFK